MRERHQEHHEIFVGADARRVTFPRHVLRQQDPPRRELHLFHADAIDLTAPADDDHVLALRRGVALPDEAAWPAQELRGGAVGVGSMLVVPFGRREAVEASRHLLLLAQQESLRQIENRPVYPYSVVPGGVTDARELKWAAQHDPVVASHYAGFDYDHARVVRLLLARAAYVSYRIGNDVYHVGSLSPWIKLNMLFERYQWLMVASILFFCFLIAVILRSILRKKARARLQGNS